MLLVFISDSFEEIAFCIFGLAFCDLGCDQMVADKTEVFKHKISKKGMRKSWERHKGRNYNEFNEAE